MNAAPNKRGQKEAFPQQSGNATVRQRRPHSLWFHGAFLSSDLRCPQAKIWGPPRAHQQPQQEPIRLHQWDTGDAAQTLWPYSPQELQQNSPVSVNCVCVCVHRVFVCAELGWGYASFTVSPLTAETRVFSQRPWFFGSGLSHPSYGQESSTT